MAGKTTKTVDGEEIDVTEDTTTSAEVGSATGSDLETNPAASAPQDSQAQTSETAANLSSESTFVNKDQELDDTGVAAKAGSLPLGEGSGAGGVNADGPKEQNFTVPTPDNQVARGVQAARPEAPVFDPNQIPHHENRLEIGRQQQAALTEVMKNQSKASNVEPTEQTT